MRASFMLTHRVGEGFDFMRYIELSVSEGWCVRVGCCGGRRGMPAATASGARRAPPPLPAHACPWAPP